MALHARIRRARNKYPAPWRAAQRVSGSGGRGKSFKKNQQARDKAEVFGRRVGTGGQRLSNWHARLKRNSKRGATRSGPYKAGQKPGCQAGSEACPEAEQVPKRGDAKNRSTRTSGAGRTPAQGARRQASATRRTGTTAVGSRSAMPPGLTRGGQSRATRRRTWSVKWSELASAPEGAAAHRGQHRAR